MIPTSAAAPWSNSIQAGCTQTPYANCIHVQNIIIRSANLVFPFHWTTKQEVKPIEKKCIIKYLCSPLDKSRIKNLPAAISSESSNPFLFFSTNAYNYSCFLWFIHSLTLISTISIVCCKVMNSNQRNDSRWFNCKEHSTFTFFFFLNCISSSLPLPRTIHVILMPSTCI